LSDTGDLLTSMTDRLLANELDDATLRGAAEGIWPQRAWDALVEQGLPVALVQGEAGFGLTPMEGLDLIRLLGRRAVPLPLVETMIANAVLADAGLPLAEGVVALVADDPGVTLVERDGDWHATGVAERVAWGRHATTLLIGKGDRVGVMSAGFRTVAEGCNLASMPRDRMALDGSVTVGRLAGSSLLESAALARALAMAGALETLVGMTVAYVTERHQFGKPLSANQAVQHSLARLAGEAAAAAAAADLAAQAYASASEHLAVAVAAARSRIGEAVGTATGIAHQLHGAIGFTQEHRLHRFTTALWSWRDEFGSAAWWTRRLGAAALTRPATAYWPLITSV
jgi:acyl-CoA dehydrogenase